MLETSNGRVGVVKKVEFASRGPTLWVGLRDASCTGIFSALNKENEWFSIGLLW